MRHAGADRRARRLLRWYPKAWRLRYGEEFTELLTADISERPRSWHRTLDVARRGVAARLVPRPRSRFRLAAAALIVAGALAGAAFIHWHVWFSCPNFPTAVSVCTPAHNPWWVNPTALALCLLGVAAAARVLATTRSTQPE
jgi:hypothetical protein